MRSSSRIFLVIRTLILFLIGITGFQVQAEETPEKEPVVINADFPGGNILVESYEGKTVRIAPDQLHSQRLIDHLHPAARVLQNRISTAAAPTANNDSQPCANRFAPAR